MDFNDWIGLQRAAFEAIGASPLERSLHPSDVMALCAWLTLTEEEQRRDDVYITLSKLCGQRAEPSRLAKSMMRCGRVLSEWLAWEEVDDIAPVTQAHIREEAPWWEYCAGQRVRHRTQEYQALVVGLLMSERRDGKGVVTYEPILAFIYSGQLFYRSLMDMELTPDQPRASEVQGGMNDFHIHSSLTWTSTKTGRKVRVSDEEVPGRKTSNDGTRHRVKLLSCEEGGRDSLKDVHAFWKEYRPSELTVVEVEVEVSHEGPRFQVLDGGKGGG